MSIENGTYLLPIQASSVVDSVVSRLVSAIMSGELKPGMKIPTEPDLVKAFGVGRSTIREAIISDVIRNCASKGKRSS